MQELTKAVVKFFPVIVIVLQRVLVQILTIIKRSLVTKRYLKDC